MGTIFEVLFQLAALVCVVSVAVVIGHCIATCLGG
jgi:hypothetical protein